MINQLKKEKKKVMLREQPSSNIAIHVKKTYSTHGLLERILVSCQKKPTKRF